MAKDPKETDDIEYIYRPWITLRNGKILYATQCGKKVFKIPVKSKKPPKQ